MADFADKLQQVMAGRSQEWLAKAAGVAQTSISAYLRRASRPSWDHVQAIAKALGVGCAELQDDELPTLPPTPPVPRRGRPPKSQGPAGKKRTN